MIDSAILTSGRIEPELETKNHKPEFRRTGNKNLTLCTSLVQCGALASLILFQPGCSKNTCHP
jgi:hypothetical protein